MGATEGRLSSEDRREQILAAATAVFGERGYAGGTTDAIAREAGISQAYVVRMFGSKEQLFLEVARRAVGRLEAEFRAVISQFSGEETMLERQSALGRAYGELVADRGILLSLLHLFGLGHDPVFGPEARDSFLGVYRLVREEAGFSPEDATDFFARGMLNTILLAMRMPDRKEDPMAFELLSTSMGPQCEAILALYEDAPARA
ncbi:helix-turn-helix domain-containing protein [Demequina sp. SYSU T00039]|uniref:Helix-turn-helix domain-containing protein n=1 Tax=Demequina lignilytica TaxID=3051663 RepID=A0AAW7M0R9_9MICO|nr:MULTISPECIES: helix-turn-helix domain-containing protein [unclassified Demequina]MDN4477955.1 helix-turn-helix domain-containing protein [Demequina sp. SYSU T00039-1]MDN4487864.1 helix-turn-helix domain-containing protein [Demequina sp. SYSU T00039]MDN4490753.1 helix-turn-helix domain-containing protein [Demequina sp. SYSU T00068]